METPIPNPFNGAEVFNGQHHRAPPGPFDDEDFGPETDVDMVDDVLLSPAIAAAKALVHDVRDDDFERQRQQMKEFDDPVDLDHSRDTPTPPAHEVARDASGDNLAESGGEESEEEWNYIPGNDTQNQASAQAAASKQDEEDMNSQLNPHAAEFIPVSPKRLLMDDTIIASSPARGFEKSLDNVPVPSELEFISEISKRPGDIEYSDGPKHGDGCFDNFSTLLNKSKEFIPAACSELASESIVNLNGNAEEHVPFDKLAALQNMEEKVTSAVMEKANIFGMNNDFSNNAFEATNIFGKSDLMTASFMGRDLPSSPEFDDNLVPGTPRSMTVEAPTSPINEEMSRAVHQTELDSPVDDFVADTQKSSDLPSPVDGPQDGITSVQERTSSSGFESESGADEVELNVASNEGFNYENRTSPSVELKPTTDHHNFSDTNPFGAHQNPSPTSHLDQFDIPKESQVATPGKDFGVDQQVDIMNAHFSSFISPRSTEEAVPFDQLESPEHLPPFLHPPSANSSFLATELPVDESENVSPVKSETNELQTTNYKTNINEITQELFSDDSNLHIMGELLDTTEGFVATESKIIQDELECEQTSKQDEGNTKHVTYENHSAFNSKTAADQVLAAFDDMKIEENEIEMRHDSQEFGRDSDIEVETKEMKLEFESHIASSETMPQELKTLDEGFEIINHEELTQVHSEDSKDKPEQVLDLPIPKAETNPFNINDDALATELDSQRQQIPVESQKMDFMSSVDQFNASINEDLIAPESFKHLSAAQETHSDFEPAATKTVSYQTLTPANEPQMTKSESYITGEKEETKSSISEDIVSKMSEQVVASKEDKKVFWEAVQSAAHGSEPVESTVVKETLITALEEISEVPSTALMEEPSTTGTPPPTPAVGLDDSKELQDTPQAEILVAAVAAAGAVSAGSAILAEKDSKKKEVVTKKPAVGAKKPSDVKPSVKSTTTKAPAAKPAAAKTTTSTTTTNKLPGTMSKTLTAANKTAPTKPSSASAAAKKPAAATTSKPAPSAAAKPTSTSTKPVPKQLSISSKTTLTTTKSPNKPLTPTSKPTTPITLKSPLVKSDATKSPTKPGLKSPLATKTLASKTATEKPGDKKPLTNGEIKPLLKKAEVPKMSTTTPTTARTMTKSAPATKSAAPISKTAAPKPLTTTNVAKPKSASAAATKPNVATKRPSTAPPARPASATGKQVPSAKPALNGKSAPAKTVAGIKKTDPKLSAAKPETKPPPIKKPEELKKEEEKPVQIQEPAITTTNGFADHNEDEESLKVEDLAPTAVESVN